MTLTTKTPEELQTLLATARKSATAIEAELKRRADEEAEKARKRVRPLEITGPDCDGDYRIKIGGEIAYLKPERTARVHAYADCLAKVAEERVTQKSNFFNLDRAEQWIADMIAERPSTPERIQAARDAGFID